MNTKADELKAKIEKLTQQLQKIEEKHERDIAKLIRDISKKGADIRVLTGMLLDSERVLKSFEKESEAWQQAGEKFLFKSKSTSNGNKNQPIAKQAHKAA